MPKESNLDRGTRSSKPAGFEISSGAGRPSDDAEENIHWADQHAKKIIDRSGEKDVYTVAAGITPSGPKHIGNYREIITVDMVAKALQDQGKKVRFIYSWDSFDRFRKVPADVPLEFVPQMEKEIGKPDICVVDPWKCHTNWAEHWQESVEKECKLTGVNPEFLYQGKLFQACTYADLTRDAMRARKTIVQILSKFKSAAIENPESWYPLFVFCKHCWKDNTKITQYDEEYAVHFVCHSEDCNHKGKEQISDFRKDGNVKPPWRIDWPMRWFYYKEDFEPGGKDHFNAGSSYDTGKEIIKGVWNYPEPYGFMYDFVVRKGGSGKMSASKGDVLTVSVCLEVFLPETLRFLFTGTKPAKEFAIPFDDEVFKVYEDFYQAERAYFGKEEMTNEKKLNHLKRVYRFSVPYEAPKQLPVQPSFRFLADLVQILPDEKIVSFLQENKHLPVELTPFDNGRLKTLLANARTWVEKYAPEQFRLTVQETVSEETKTKLSDAQKVALNNLAVALREKHYTEEEMSAKLKEAMTSANVPPKEFFKALYLVLLGREQGPKLAQFILSIGQEKVAKILESI